MPKYGIHHIVLDNCKDQLMEEHNPIGNILNDNIAIAKLGSIGPDLFFWGPDYVIVEGYLKIYEELKKFSELYREVMEPIEEIIEEFDEKYVEPVEKTVAEWFPGATGLIKTLKNTKEATEVYIKNAKPTVILAAVLDISDRANFSTAINDFFQLFEPGHYYNRPEIDWYWFDMLHYRQSGAFAQNLITLAGTDKKKKAYAYGYLTHIATDVTGHPYVNQLVGAPYRSNIWRHVTVESFMDTWKFAQYYDGESINKELRNKLDLPKIDNFLPDEVTPLDDDIVMLLHEAFKQTYSKMLHPIRLNEDGFYTPKNIQDTYKTFVQFAYYIEHSYVSPPKEPFTDVMDILANTLSEANIPKPPLAPTNPSGSSCTWQDIFSSSPQCQDDLTEIIEEWTQYSQELIVWQGHVMVAIVDTLLVAYLTMPVMTFIALLYGIQLLAYDMYRRSRWVLSMHGLVLPEPDELNQGISERLTTLQGACWRKKYPSTGMPSRSNLDCPVDFMENLTTTASTYTLNMPRPSHQHFFDPDSFIGDANQTINLTQLKNYVNCSEPSETKALSENHNAIGNAIPLSLWMIKNADTSDLDLQKYVFANWNLDSDRGYGYKEWHGFQSKALNHNTSVSSELYIKDSRVPEPESVGDNCFSFFNSAVDGSDKPDIVNAYLLSIACQFDYMDQLYASDSHDPAGLYRRKFKNLMERWGMDSLDLSEIDNKNFIDKTEGTADTEVVIMARSNPDNPFIIVLFRGSESPNVDIMSSIRDWITTDFNAYGPVKPDPHEEKVLYDAGVVFHKGFWNAFKIVKEEILEKINHIKDSNPSVHYNVWVTGNSLGAALANICGLWLVIHGCPVEDVYTFAAPKCANGAFSDLYEAKMGKRCHRWVNGRLGGGVDHRDIVTQVPPSPEIDDCNITFYDSDLISFITMPLAKNITIVSSDVNSITLKFPYCFDHVGHEEIVDETDGYLFDGHSAMIPTKIRAHLTEGYSRGIYKELIEKHPDIAKQVPLPSL